VNHVNGLKCVICVNRALHDKDIKTVQPVIDAIEEAPAATIVFQGTSFCAKHYHEHMVNLSITGIKL